MVHQLRIVVKFCVLYNTLRISLISIGFNMSVATEFNNKANLSLEFITCGLNYFPNTYTSMLATKYVLRRP